MVTLFLTEWIPIFANYKPGGVTTGGNMVVTSRGPLKRFQTERIPILTDLAGQEVLPPVVTWW